MSLPDERVLALLKSQFVVGWKNIAREDYVGASHGYACDELAVGTTNGAGPRNVQMFVLSRGGVVVHCLPGFWHPEDLVVELQHARAMHRLWTDGRSRGDKKAMFARMQRRAARQHPAAMTARSGWQGFDANAERNRLAQLQKKRGANAQRDTFHFEEGKNPALKPISLLVHERMAEQPFVPFRSFDVDRFVDYGRSYYDNNRGKGVGVTFGSKGAMASQRRMAERRAQRAAKKARDKERMADERARKAREQRKTAGEGAAKSGSGLRDPQL